MRYSHRPSETEVAPSAPTRSTTSSASRASSVTTPTSREPAQTRPGVPRWVTPRRQVIELVLTWSGGQGVDLVKLVVDEAFRRPRDIRLESRRERLAIELEVDARSFHTVQLMVSFVGESRADLALGVYVDGVRVGGSAAPENASQRWEVEWTGP